MNHSDEFLNVILDNIKKLFFPEEWLELDLKLSKTELFMMLLLARREQTTMTELSDVMGVPMSTATGLADRLVRKHYVKRERSESDRRTVALVLTETGEKLILEFRQVMAQYFSMVMDGLTLEEQQYLIRIAMKIFQNLQARKTEAAAESTEKNKMKRIQID
jgi:DNA-binding MarR family transcriptional regulator